MEILKQVSHSTYEFLIEPTHVIMLNVLLAIDVIIIFMAVLFEIWSVPEYSTIKKHVYHESD